MKNIIRTLSLCLIFMIGCKSVQKENTITYVSFGDKISAENAVDRSEMAEKYKSLKFGDTLNVKFISEVKSVCQKKGCWINVPLNEGKSSFVKFKDYAFFMPFNASGSQVVLNGKAFKNEISVKELQHYAKDAGKSKEEIAKIIAPKVTYSFLADGVLLATKKDDKK